MMKKLLFTLTLLLFLCLTAQSREKKFAVYSVAFYNLENLFDTIHDKGKNDYEYLPDAKIKWNTEKYTNKLTNLSKVISELARNNTPAGPAVIGVAEAENRRVLEDLVKQPAIAGNNYQIVHFEGPDKRGIDCALLYNPDQFTVTSTKLSPYIYVNDTVHKTRGFLIVGGMLGDEKVHFIVNHWPSRGAAEPARIRAAEQVKILKDSLFAEDHKAKIIIMGDMNDDPMDKSMETLGARRKQKEVRRGEFYNPWWNTLVDKGVGTLLYRGKWNLFDQIVVSSTLLNKKRSSLKFLDSEVFLKDYLFQQDGKYKGYPLRTQAGGEWLNGYSDHFPTIIYLIKEIR